MIVITLEDIARHYDKKSTDFQDKGNGSFLSFDGLLEGDPPENTYWTQGRTTNNWYLRIRSFSEN